MLNEKFKDRMKKMLGSEYEAFILALEEQAAVRGVRINSLKAEISSVTESGRFDLTPLSYAADGFILSQGEGIGNTPEHHAGMIYVQDPGAMATANALDIEEGWRVLDMCAAPGGKSGQAAAKIGDTGFLLSNEYVPKRAKTVVSNFERLGVKNAIVTSLDTAELPRLFSHFFNLVIADVPCSGEGMFRKSEEALTEWSEENVAACAERQRTILKNAAPLVADGGYLLYSTCTFSLEENEMAVEDFLFNNPDFTLVPVKDELSAVTSDGIQFAGARVDSLSMCRRFYPHVAKGEGQFVALIKRRDGLGNAPTILYKSAAKPLTKSESLAVSEFFSKNLTKAPVGDVVKIGENLVIISHGCPVPPKSVFSAGVLLGTLEKSLLRPAHQFFSAYGPLFVRKEFLSHSDPRLNKYLRGEEIDAVSVRDNGWCAVFFENSALGGGKASGGKIKNHYPKGLRNN